VDQKLPPEGEEKDHPLEDANQPGRKARALKAVARVGQAAQEKRDEDD
jgi:hypothetical protein